MTPENVRACWERAESLHPGPLRLYARDLAAYLADIERLIGSDEHACEICGATNFQPDGSAGVFLWGHQGRYFCDAHWSAHAVASVREHARG